jgi:MoxR-like ATPase
MESDVTPQILAKAVGDNVGRVMVGLTDVIELLLVALLCDGHVLLEDVPGTGKTTLAKSLANSLGCSFQRIQFTPDLLPSDITGVSVFNQKLDEFQYRPGPIMSQVLLADEINRAGPRTQSALLEAMQERQVTVDGVSRALPVPFIVLATQNPIELEGTFPLPEAQIDRFLMRLRVGYPEFGDEREILRRFRVDDPLTLIQAVVSSEQIGQAAVACRNVFVHPVVEDYILHLTRSTRVEPTVELGISPRGSLALYHTSQALAAIRGRSYVLPDDVKHLALPVLTHRLILSPDARLRGRDASEVIAELLNGVPVPVEEAWSSRV